MNSNRRVVYSTDPKDHVKMKNDTRPMNAAVDLQKLTIIFRIEKAGRGGKIVTILSGLPLNEEFVTTLAKELKAKCGTGGTYKFTSEMAEIEIQGDKRDQIKKILQTKSIRFKGM